MGKPGQSVNATVTSVFPNKVRIEIKDIESFKVAGEKLSVGSYLRISDSDDCAIIGCRILTCTQSGIEVLGSTATGTQKTSKFLAVQLIIWCPSPP